MIDKRCKQLLKFSREYVETMQHLQFNKTTSAEHMTFHNLRLALVPTITYNVFWSIIKYNAAKMFQVIEIVFQTCTMNRF